jgi:hypothetical protein
MVCLVLHSHTLPEKSNLPHLSRLRVLTESNKEIAVSPRLPPLQMCRPSSKMRRCVIDLTQFILLQPPRDAAISRAAAASLTTQIAFRI